MQKDRRNMVLFQLQSYVSHSSDFYPCISGFSFRYNRFRKGIFLKKAYYTDYVTVVLITLSNFKVTYAK